MENRRVFVLLLFLTVFSYANATKVYVTWDEKTRTFSLKESQTDDAVSWAVFDNSINKTGWSYLEVYTNGSYDDSKQAYAAGLAEGHLTKDLIEMSWQNGMQGYCVKPLSEFCQKLQKYLSDNIDWIFPRFTQEEVSPYWHQTKLMYDQISGLMDGYKGTPGYPNYEVDVTGLFLTQISGDLDDLESALGKRTGQQKILGNGRCSALVKVLPGQQDLYVAQDTWIGFSSMLRVLKKYDFQYHMTSEKDSAKIPGEVMTFSSYPGLIASGDDFYTISSGLTTLETTIGNDNPDLWQYVVPQGSLLEGIRNMVANRLASSGLEWVQIFSEYNSGTYNNEWMVVDYNKFKPGQKLEDGLLYVLEQIPEMIEYGDQTDFLRKNSYWPSYNVPFYPGIFNLSGAWDSVKKYGDWFTWEHTPRANIFRRDHSKVKDTDSMTKLMRYNDFTHDPLSRCNCTPPYSGENAISARSDLNPANGTYPFSALGHRAHGGTDMKLTSSSLVKSLQFIAVSSPTYDNVPPFQWSKSDFKDTLPHVGHPDLWTFKPEVHVWGNRSLS